MLPLTSQTFYAVFADYYGPKKPFKRRPYLGFEAIVDGRCLSRVEVINDLVTGQFSGEIRQIVEVDLGKGTSRDVTREIGDEVDNRLAARASRDGEEHETPDWIEAARYRLPAPRRAA